jgi:anti-sigma factor RsiW
VHLTDETTERLVAGDLSDRDERDARRHLAACASCAERMRALEHVDRAIERTLRSLDHTPPLVGPRAIVERAGSAPRRRAGLVAAGAAAAVFATAALAMPGSPIASWWRGSAEASSDAPGAPPAVVAPGVVTPAPAPVSGIRLVPDIAFELAFESPQASGAIRVSLLAQDEVSVHADGVVEYAVLPAGVLIRNRGARASYEVRVPETLPRLRVRVGQRLVFAKERDEITTIATRDDLGVYVVPLAPEPR